MSRLRRPFLYDRFFFVTVAWLTSRRRLQDPDFERLTYALARMRRQYGSNSRRLVFSKQTVTKKNRS